LASTEVAELRRIQTCLRPWRSHRERRLPETTKATAGSLELIF